MFRILNSLFGVWECGKHGLSCLKKHKVVVVVVFYLAHIKVYSCVQIQWFTQAKGLYVLIDTTTQALARKN